MQEPLNDQEPLPFEPSELIEYGKIEDITRNGGTVESLDGSTGYS